MLQFMELQSRTRFSDSATVNGGYVIFVTRKILRDLKRRINIYSLKMLEGLPWWSNH